MESIKHLYKIGNGPSSSHTLGPKNAAEAFLKRGENCSAASFRVTLYGSLAATGKGHLTDRAIINVLQQIAPVEIIWEPDIVLDFHTNGMLYESLNNDGSIMDSWTIYSIGGGTIANPEMKDCTKNLIYKHKTIADIQAYCQENGLSYWEYVYITEGESIVTYLEEVWEVMCNSIKEGLDTEGVLEGGLGVRRKACDYFIRAKGYTDNLKSRGTVFAYALAVAEMNGKRPKIGYPPQIAFRAGCSFIFGRFYLFFLKFLSFFFLKNTR